VHAATAYQKLKVLHSRQSPKPRNATKHACRTMNCKQCSSCCNLSACKYLACVPVWQDDGWLTNATQLQLCTAAAVPSTSATCHLILQSAITSALLPGHATTTNSLAWQPPCHRLVGHTKHHPTDNWLLPNAAAMTSATRNAHHHHVTNQAIASMPSTPRPTTRNAVPVQTDCAQLAAQLVQRTATAAPATSSSCTATATQQRMRLVHDTINLCDWIATY
jgi:hypothetical protein